MGSPKLDYDEMDVEGSSGGDKAEIVEEESVQSDNQQAEEEVELEKKLDVEESNAVTFSPPVYIQRYCRVRELLQEVLDSPKYKELQRDTGKTVMEVGCAEFGMMRHFKNILDIGKIIFVDVDKQLLEEKGHYLKPLPAEYLQRISRPQPLVIEAYAGCVTKVDPDIQNNNPNILAVVGIEIVEHLHPDVLRGFEETVFGIISPQLVIVTTPNSDFNEVFNLPPGKFRHWDHKFEWSRKEFQLWCDKIVCEFINYEYRIEGICEGPEETKHLGCVSQMAIFEKREGFNTNVKDSLYASRIQPGSYTLIHRVEFPNYTEKRTPDEIVLHEFNFYVNTYLFSRSMVNQYEEEETKEVIIPLDRILSIDAIEKAVKGDKSTLQSILQNEGYLIRSDNVVINVEEYIEANFTDNRSENSDEGQLELCEDMIELDVNRVIPPDVEEWE